MIRGEYIINGIVVPNQYTIYGVQSMLRATFQGVGISNLAVGLCAHNPADMIALASVQEPTIGVNGYQRQVLSVGTVNWPKLGLVNSEAYVESREFTFPISGALDVAVNRLFLTDGEQVLSISSAFQEGMRFFNEPKTAKYRLYVR